MAGSADVEAFQTARAFLLAHREDYATAYDKFRWPQLTEFNWAVDWLDQLAIANGQPAVWIVEQDGSERRLSYAEMSRRSNQVANWLRGQGVRRGDRLILMLGNQVELWETILATMKLGAVLIPATPLLGPADLRDRIERGNARHVVVGSGDTGKFAELPGAYTRVTVGPPVDGWHDYSNAYGESQGFDPDGVTRADDTLLLYFTSGTTARPKLVEHTHASYPVGHLSTMYWIGLRPGDVHLNISSPGWAKHAWSNVFAPWSAGATALILGHERFSAPALLGAIGECCVTTPCPPPTVWRLLIPSDPTSASTAPPRDGVPAPPP